MAILSVYNLGKIYTFMKYIHSWKYIHSCYLFFDTLGRTFFIKRARKGQQLKLSQDFLFVPSELSQAGPRCTAQPRYLSAGYSFLFPLFTVPDTWCQTLPGLGGCNRDRHRSLGWCWWLGHSRQACTMGAICIVLPAPPSLCPHHSSLWISQLSSSPPTYK